jgi:hypothetical protein
MAQKVSFLMWWITSWLLPDGHDNHDRNDGDGDWWKK